MGVPSPTTQEDTMATKKVTPKNPEKKADDKADEKAETRKTAGFRMGRKSSTFKMK
jgi:hypothetical protein